MHGPAHGHDVTTSPGDGWNAGETYEAFMGRWSRPLAREFVRWVDVPPGCHWLDVGTGTGALAGSICALAQPGSVVACDPSGPFIEAARSALPDARLTFVVAGSGSLPRRRGGYDAVVSGLALNFFPDPDRAVREKVEVARSGGVVGAYVWDYAGGMEFLRYFWEAAEAIGAAVADVDERRRFPICGAEPLASAFATAGAEGVRGTELSVPTRFVGFDDYWSPFLGGTGPAPSLVSTLSRAAKASMVGELRDRLPIRPDGSIELRASAWAVVGHAPCDGPCAG